MLGEHEQSCSTRGVLRIKRLSSQLIAATARGPVARAIEVGLDSGAISTLGPQPDRGDHVAMAIVDAARLLVVVEGSAFALLIHQDGSFNWVEGGAVRFPADSVRRLLLCVAPRMEWKRRCSLGTEVHTRALDAIPAAVRDHLGAQSVVLMGAEAAPRAPEEVLDQDGILELLSEVAELDHRATPAVVRRVVAPGQVQPPDAWRVGEGVFEAPAFEGPQGSTALDIVTVLADPEGELPPCPGPPLPALEVRRPARPLQEEPTLRTRGQDTPSSEGHDLDATLDRARPAGDGAQAGAREARIRGSSTAAVVLFLVLGSLLLAAVAAYAL